MLGEIEPRRPGLRTRARALGLLAAGAVGFWVLFVSLASLYAVLVAGYRYQPQNLVYDSSLVLLGAAFAVAIRVLLERLTGQVFWRQLLFAALILIAIAPLFEAAFRLMNTVVRASGPADLRPQVVAAAAVFWLAPLGLWAALNLALLHDAEARRRERRLAEARVQAHEAQVRALRYQVNPHLLYNALNSVASLILDGRNADAETMVMRLSDFLRSSLANDPLVDVRLADEIALQRLYLDIEEARFSDTLRVEIEASAAVQDALVPSLILQPLVENALKHGLRGPGEMTLLRIRAARDGDRLAIEVSDNGLGAAALSSGTGVGLKNVERRVATRYAGRGRVEAAAHADGFRVRLDLPLELA